MSQQPYYARRNDSGEYTVAGNSYPSVTTVLGMKKGEFLLAWAAKMGCMKTASHLVQAGVIKPEMCDEKLMEFCRELTDRRISAQDAIKEIANWKSNMKEYERYRDFKGRIGSVAHHAAYEHAMKGCRPCSEDHIMDYLRGIVHELKLCHFEDGERTIEPTNAMIDAIASPALSYVHSVWEWIESANPEWDAIGQEAVVYRSSFDIGFAYDGKETLIEFPGYAGTMDWIATFRKSTYKGDWRWEEDEVRVTGDFKTSNALPDSVRMQCEAYSECEDIVLIETGEHLKFDRSNYVACAHVGPHPKYSGTVTEFGTLEAKTKQQGTTLWSWKKNPTIYAGFLGMCAAYHAGKQDTRAIEKHRKPAAPKPPTRLEKKAAPFG